MRLWTLLRLRLRSLFSRDRVERELDEELSYHLSRQAEADAVSGVRPEETRRTLAGLQQRREECRDARGLNLVDHATQDLRFALRQLARSQGFAATAVLMIGLGMGASVAIFAFVDAALLEPLPYAKPEQLLEVTEQTKQIAPANLSYLDYVDWKRQITSLSGFAVHNGRNQMLRTASGTEVVTGARVSDGFFRTLGVTPLVGRDFYDGEDRPSAAPAVILSYATWMKRFGGRTDIIGQSFTLTGVPHTIVGILPQSFQFAPRGAPELWTTLQASGGCETSRGCHNLVGIGRLRDGVTVDAARAEMVTIARQLEAQYPDTNRDQGASVQPLASVIVGDIRPVLLVLLGGAGLLLLIGCVNVASLVLVRSESRSRELAVRSALGASKLRLMRQFLTEGMVLVGIGSIVGVITAIWLIDALVRLVPAQMLASMPFLTSAGLNGRVIAAATMVAALATLVCTLPPSLRVSRSAQRNRVAMGERGSSGNTWQRLGFKLVVLELATAVVLLAGAGLLGKSLYRLLNVDLGFQPQQLATLSVAVPRSTYPANEQLIAVSKRIVDRVTSLPGVASVGLASVLPVSFNGNTDWIRFVGRPYNGEHNEVNQRDVSSGYLQTVGARLVRGRYFTEADDAAKPRVVIINQALADRYFPGQDPIGQRFGDTNLTQASIKEVVGIVADIREGQLDSDIWPAVYYPFNQSPDSGFALVVRTTQSETSVLPSLAGAIAEIDPGIGTVRAATMADRITDSPVAYLRRSSAWLLGGFAVLALLLGIVGLYGVIAYTVSQRRREIGVRLALGAQRGSVYQLILGDAARLTAVGVAIGLTCSVGGAVLARNLLFGTEPWDVPTLAATAGVLGLAALLASYIPARRAASVDPVEALRSE